MEKVHEAYVMILLEILKLSSHTDNKENNFLVLGEGLTQGINDCTGAVEKKI